MSLRADGEHIAVRVPAADAERFRLACAAEGRTVSAVLRALIDAYARHVAHNDDDPESGNPRAVETPEKEAPLAAPV